MIIIVDYGVGNLGSIANMFKKIGVPATISSDPKIIETADKLILPGIGAFDAGMAKLMERGFVPVLNHLVLDKKIPVLGHCLGLQVMTRSSEEGQLNGLGWFNAETLRFKFDEGHSILKVPHMGWNTIDICQPHPLLSDLEVGSRYYFVHSFYVESKEPDTVLATTDYGGPFHSVLARGNIMGAQFHPEKSHKFGMRILKNFSEM